MPEEVRLWKIDTGDKLQEIQRTPLNFEARLEAWLTRDISCLDPGLLIIGQQVPTDFGGIIDLLCLDQAGDVVVIELKRDKTPREITAQILDYGSWVKDLSNERITSIAEAYLGRSKFEKAFKDRFGEDLPETLNENHRLLIVASEIDASSERIINYLSDSYGVNINAVTFQYFKSADGSELMARVFLLEPEQVEIQSRTRGGSKRRINLTFTELEAIADEKGVGDLYRHAVEGLSRLFAKHTTRSSIGFTANFNGSRKTVVSFIPQESSSRDGIKFQLYIRRFKAMFKLSEEAALSILPPKREPWVYFGNAGPDYEGFQGFFANDDELQKFTNGLATIMD